MEERCLHSMVLTLCSFCNPKPNVIKPKSQANGSKSAGKRTCDKAVEPFDYCVIYAAEGPSHPSFSRLTVYTKKVHIRGQPLLWALEKIVKNAPNVTTVQMPLSSEKNMTHSHLKFFKDHGITLVWGYDKPALAWDNSENRSPTYLQQKKFLEELDESQKIKFGELLTIGFEEALVLKRYFCLNGEAFLHQRQLVQACGFSARNGPNVISVHINAVLYYLGYVFNPSKAAREKAEAIANKVCRMRRLLEAPNRLAAMQEEVDTICKSYYSFQKIVVPENLKLTHFETFKMLVRKHFEGKLRELKQDKFAYYEILKLRFGFNKAKRCITLEGIGKIQGVSKQAIRDKINRALNSLGLRQES